MRGGSLSSLRKVRSLWLRLEHSNRDRDDIPSPHVENLESSDLSACCGWSPTHPRSLDSTENTEEPLSFRQAFDAQVFAHLDAAEWRIPG